MNKFLSIHMMVVRWKPADDYLPQFLKWLSQTLQTQATVFGLPGWLKQIAFAVPISILSRHNTIHSEVAAQAKKFFSLYRLTSLVTIDSLPGLLDSTNSLEGIAGIPPASRTLLTLPKISLVINDDGFIQFDGIAADKHSFEKTVSSLQQLYQNHG